MALEIPLAIADRLLPLERLSGGGPKKRNPEAPIGAEAMFLGGWLMNKYMDEKWKKIPSVFLICQFYGFEAIISENPLLLMGYS